MRSDACHIGATLRASLAPLAASPSQAHPLRLPPGYGTLWSSGRGRLKRGATVAVRSLRLRHPWLRLRSLPPALRCGGDRGYRAGALTEGATGVGRLGLCWWSRGSSWSKSLASACGAHRYAWRERAISLGSPLGHPQLQPKCRSYLRRLPRGQHALRGCPVFHGRADQRHHAVTAS
jgi:hypothetical protein